MKLKENKVVSRRKVNRYSIEECKKSLDFLASKSQLGSRHYANVQARYMALGGNFARVEA